MTYDELLIEAEKDGLTVKEMPLQSASGRCSGKRIAIRQDIPTLTEKADVLAEEMGHYNTTVGRIVDLDTVEQRKQERRARLWGYNKRIGLMGIVSAYKAQCASLYEISDHLGVSEESLTEALEYYRQIYGRGTIIDNYFVQFEPYLTVYEYLMIN